MDVVVAEDCGPESRELSDENHIFRENLISTRLVFKVWCSKSVILVVSMFKKNGNRCVFLGNSRSREVSLEFSFEILLKSSELLGCPALFG